MMIVYQLEWYGSKSKWVVKKKGHNIAELFKGRVEPNKEYYIKPNGANMFYSTTFDPSRDIEQIEDLKSCNKIWIPK